MSQKVIMVAVIFAAAFATVRLFGARVPFQILKAPKTFTAAERADGQQLYTERVKPILRKCSNCHGEDDARSGLRVDSRAALLCGGHRGPAIALGRPGDSLLIQAVQQTGELKMPRRGKLSPDEVKALEDWIKDGAPWPGDTDSSWKDRFGRFVNCIL